MRKTVKARIWAGCTLFSRCGSYTGSILLTVYALLNINYVAQNTSGVTRDWNNDLISRIVPEADIGQLEAYEYADYWRGTFPGTVEGCHCTVRNSRRRVYPGLFRRECNRNETIVGCKQIAPTEQIPLVKFVDQAAVPVIRIKNSSYIDLMNFTLDSGDCVAGYKKCSDFCVPEKLKACPLTAIRVASAPNRTNPDPSVFDAQVDFPSFSLFTSSSPKFKTITDTQIAERAVCVSPGTSAVTPGRKPYALLASDWDSCIEDPRFERLDGLGEMTLFQYNGVDWKNASYVDFQTSENYIWYRFFGTAIKMKQSCLPLQAEISAYFPDRLAAFKTAAWVLVIIMWVFFGIALMLHIAQTLVTFIGGANFHEGRFNTGDEKVIRAFGLLYSLVDLLAILLIFTVLIIFARTTSRIYSVTLLDCFDSDAPAVYLRGYVAAKTKVFYRFLGAAILQMALNLFCWAQLFFVYTENGLDRTVV